MAVFDGSLNGCLDRSLPHNRTPAVPQMLAAPPAKNMFSSYAMRAPLPKRTFVPTMGDYTCVAPPGGPDPTGRNPIACD